MRRVPLKLVGTYNTRFGTTSGLSGSSGIVGVGIVGSMVVGQSLSSADKDQRFINCFPQVVDNPLTGAKTPYLVKRPGFASNTTPSAGTKGYAIFVWSGQGTGNSVISAFDTPNSTVYNGTSSIGTLTGVCTAITETILSGTANLVFTTSASRGYFYPDGGAMTQITDVDWPGTGGLGLTLAGTFAHLDNYAFIMCTDGKIYQSDLNSLSAWTAGLSISASAYPDKGVACVRHKNRIIGFGTQSMEFFYNAGNATGSTLSRIENMAQKIGLVNADAITSWRDALFWVGSSPQGGIKVYSLESTIATISTSEIEQQLMVAGTTNIRCNMVAMFGRMHLFIKASTSTFAYCIESKFWYEVIGNEPLWTSTAAQSTGADLLTYAVSNISTTGKTFVINPAAHTFKDNGFNYTAVARTSLIDFENNDRKQFIALEVIGDVEGEVSPLYVDWTDNDYQTYQSSPRSVDMNNQLRRLYRLGTARRRAFVFTHSANTPMRIQRVDLTIS